MSGLLLISMGSLGAAWASFTLEQIARAGQEAPGGGTFVNFEPLAINRNGAVLFDAKVRGPWVFHGIYMSRDAGLSRLVAVGDRTPFGGSFLDLSWRALNDLGHVVFLGSANGRVPRAIFLSNGSALKKVVGVREALPGLGRLKDLSDVALNNTETVAFVGRVESGKIPKALFVTSNGVVNRLLSVGDSSPLGGTFAEFANPSLNNKGQIAFEGNVYGGTAPRGIFLVSKSGLRRIVAAGDPSPLGGSFDQLTLPKMSDNGDLVFWAGLRAAEAPSGLFRASNGTIEKVVARGEPTPSGGRFSFIGLSYSSDGHGALAFHAKIANADVDAGIFLTADGSLTDVVLVGDATPLGGRFKTLSSPLAGPQGTVAFAGQVKGGRAPSGLFLAVPQK